MLVVAGDIVIDLFFVELCPLTVPFLEVFAVKFLSVH
jgi:hypothetical protein